MASITNYIEIKGANIHNLKNIDVKIPKNKLTVITGVSGSGKSSLAFDTLYEEGKKRYLLFSGSQFMAEVLLYNLHSIMQRRLTNENNLSFKRNDRVGNWICIASNQYGVDD